MSNKPLFVDYETTLTAAVCNTIADTVWDALGEATTPAEALAYMNGVPETDQGATPVVRVEGQWVPLSPAEIGAHNDLLGRFEDDAHPIEAITGLSTTLSGINDAIGALGNHSGLVNRDAEDSHPTAAITGLDSTLSGLDSNVATLQDQMSKAFLSVSDYGAVGDGTTDDTAAIQAAIDAASALVFAPINDRLFQGGVSVFFPSPADYRITTPLYVSTTGVVLRGDGRGARIKADNCDGIIIGDTGGTATVRSVGIENLVIRSTNKDNSNTGIWMYRSVEACIKDVEVIDFSTGIKFTRCTHSSLSGSLIYSSGRTISHGVAGILFEGTDESAWAVPDTSSPGAGAHVTDCELFGGGTDDVYRIRDGILVTSIDGLYITQCHTLNYSRGLHIAPEAIGSRRTITDVQVVNCYFDKCEDSDIVAGNTGNVTIGGYVSDAVPLASGATIRSIYQGIRFSNCLFRGALTSGHCLMIAVTDLSAGLDYQTTPNTYYHFSDIQVTGCQLRMSNKGAIEVRGANSGNYAEPYGLSVIGCNIVEYNADSTVGVGGAINAEAMSMLVDGNFIGVPRGTCEYVVRVLPRDSGASDPPGAQIQITNNNLSDARSSVGEFFRIARTGDAQLHIKNNMLPGAGCELAWSQEYETTNATTLNTWFLALQDGETGYADVSIVGLSGADSVVYRYRASFKRSGTSCSLNNGTTTFDLVSGWNPAGLATPPVAIMDACTLRVQVTGQTGETWKWKVHVNLLSTVAI